MGTHVSVPLLLFFFDYSLAEFLFQKAGCSSSRLLDNKKHKLLPFPLLRSWFPFAAVLGQSWPQVTAWLWREVIQRGREAPGVHVNGTWYPSHLRWCERCPEPGKAEERGGRGCLKNSAFWKTWLRGCSREEEPKAQLLRMWVVGGN